MLVTMRGETGERNPWQIPMGQATPEALRLAGVRTLRLERAEEANAVANTAAKVAFEEQSAVRSSSRAADRREILRGKAVKALNRREVVASLLERRGALLVVAGLGSAAWIALRRVIIRSLPAVGRDGVGVHDRSGPCARQARAPRARRHRDGEMLMGLGVSPRSRAAPGQPRRRGARQRALRRDRHAENAHRIRNRSRGGRPRVRVCHRSNHPKKR